MKRVRTLALTLILLVAAAPQAGHASTTITLRPPFAYFFTQRFCDGTPEDWGRPVAGNSVCHTSGQATASKGLLKLNESMVSPNGGVLPGTGNAFGVALGYVSAYTGTTKKITVTLTLHVRSAVATQTGATLQPLVQSAEFAAFSLAVFHTNKTATGFSSVQTFVSKPLAIMGGPSTKNKDLTLT